MSKDLFAQPDHPTAAMTRGTFPAAAVVEAAAAAGRRVPEDIEIVFDHMDETTPSIDTTLYPRVVATVPFVEHARMIGKILLEMADGLCPQPQHVVIPTEFCGAAGSDTRRDGASAQADDGVSCGTFTSPGSPKAL